MGIFKKKRGRKARCPWCGSQRTHSKGKRKTATLGNRPLRFCNNCRRRFTLGNKAKHGQPSPASQAA